VHVNDALETAKNHYKSNYVSTTKYSLITFVPKSLYEQFRRVANLYFTIVAVLSCTEMSPVSPVTTIGPLVLVIGLSVAKEAYEDYKRYRADQELNSSFVSTFRNGDYTQIKWRELKVGEIVKVRGGEFFPADLLFLDSSSKDGICYVETKNLDGETNLKIKTAVEATTKNPLELIDLSKPDIKCDRPNNSIYTFTGNLRLNPPSRHSGKKTGQELQEIPIGINNLLLRGASLRNTEYVVGCAVYCGHDTKMMMNTTRAPSKRSRLEKQIDTIIFLMLGLLFVMCGSGALLNALWTKSHGPEMWYLAPDAGNYEFDPDSVTLQALANLVTVFILYGYLIPISLYVSIELVKVMQLVFINADARMFHRETNTPANARTSNLNEELGQVHFILSDKTGTLTCNVMEFFKCSIAGISYGRGHTEVERAIARRGGVETEAPEQHAPGPKGFNFRDERLMKGNWRSLQHNHVVLDFFRLLSLCHTTIPEASGDEIVYQAESPDELAFVIAAKEFGFVLDKRTSDQVLVQEKGADDSLIERKYKVLAVLEFNSDRKRMSVVFRSPEGHITLYCKGADSVMKPLLRQNDNEFMEMTYKHATDFAGSGLRALICAKVDIDEVTFNEWNVRWEEANKSLVHRSEKMAAVAADLERELVVLGCTAIEDKLQDGVPECIETILRAGLKIWVLTGDKQETAMNIGLACGLILDSMIQFIIKTDTPELRFLKARLQDSCADLASLTKNKDAYDNHLFATLKEQLAVVAQNVESCKADDANQQFALVIDGEALDSILVNDHLADELLGIGMSCSTVICCRVSPLQKSQITGLVKKNGHMTLAIGDGANDVGMIQTAHIGVGISGQEGRQAVMASDFAIAQFRFLEFLLLDHGRLSYKRLGRMIAYFFYKNLLFGLSMYWFNASAFFSGQTIYNEFYMSMYNVCFVALPIIIVGFMDQDIDFTTRKQFPRIYRQGPANEYFDMKVKLAWMFNGIYQSVVIYAVPTAHYYMTVEPHGRMPSLWVVGTTMYTCVILSVNLNLAMVINYWTWVHHVVIWGTILAWPVFLVSFGAMHPSYSTDVHQLLAEELLDSPSFYLVCVLTISIALLPDATMRVLQRVYFCQDHHILQEIERKRRSRANRMGSKIPSLSVDMPLVDESGNSLPLLPIHQNNKVDAQNQFADQRWSTEGEHGIKIHTVIPGGVTNNPLSHTSMQSATSSKAPVR